MRAKHLFYYGGHANFYTKNNKIGGFKEASFYEDLIKEHLFGKINFVNLTPGYTFDFEKVKGLFDDFHYSEKTLKNNSLKFYDKFS